jgi:hypothetical protein
MAAVVKVLEGVRSPSDHSICQYQPYPAHRYAIVLRLGNPTLGWPYFIVSAVYPLPEALANAAWLPRLQMWVFSSLVVRPGN